jgi:hypothetical protein
MKKTGSSIYPSPDHKEITPEKVSGRFSDRRLSVAYFGTRFQHYGLNNENRYVCQEKIHILIMYCAKSAFAQL